MNSKQTNLLRRYRTVLRSHLQAGSATGLELAQGLGSQALAAGVQTLDLAKLHEKTLVTEVLPDCPAGKRKTLIKRAGAFFAMAITPMQEKHRSAREATAHLKRFIEALSQRTVELAASNLELSLEIAQRKAAESALKKSERHYSKLLKQSDRLQEQLRQLSRQILSAQEEERKKISRELHDVIVQTLTGINVRLATLKQEAVLNIDGIDRNIDRTQKLVEKSVSIVHQFARDLRPAVLDDLGLIPALRSCLKAFSARTGIRTRLSAFAGVEDLDIARRTVLFRVCQEALANAGRHSKAKLVQLKIEAQPDGIRTSIVDNGKGFQVERVVHGRRTKRLGLLGMRERLEMVGGSFSIHSVPGKGTTVEALIPRVNAPKMAKPVVGRP